MSFTKMNKKAAIQCLVYKIDTRFKIIILGEQPL